MPQSLSRRPRRTLCPVPPGSPLPASGRRRRQLFTVKSESVICMWLSRLELAMSHSVTVWLTHIRNSVSWGLVIYSFVECILVFSKRILEFLVWQGTRKRLAAGLCPDPLGKLTCSPNPKLDFWRRREGERRGRRGIRSILRQFFDSLDGGDLPYKIVEN